jgi:hypothetical protein
MKNGLYKFIEVLGEFRFYEVQPWGSGGHKSLLNVSEDSSDVQSAGTLAIFDSYWRIYDWGSNSLNLNAGRNESVILRLSQVIGKEFREEII